MIYLFAALLVLPALFIVGCSRAEITPGMRVCIIVEDDQLIPAVQQAVDVWSKRLPGVFSGDENDPTITVRLADLDPSTGAEYMLRGPESWTMFVDKRQVVRPEVVCLIQHELGHALGLKHVSEDGPDLMAANLSWDNTGCRWSQKDQDELRRVGWVK